MSTLVTFNGTNGANPLAGLIADVNGNFYGTTFYGGTRNAGTIFEIAAGAHTLTTLHAFDFDDGANPGGSLLSDGSGNFYGMAGYSVFELSPVPEPSTGLLAALAGGMIWLGRKRFKPSA
jgi:uncharacterized repeat protein (TIGR03803 family)